MINSVWIPSTSLYLFAIRRVNSPPVLSPSPLICPQTPSKLLIFGLEISLSAELSLPSFPIFLILPSLPSTQKILEGINLASGIPHLYLL